MAKTLRARIDAENDHRRATRPRLRIIVKETQGYPTGYLRAQSDTIEHGPESREVGCDEAKRKTAGRFMDNTQSGVPLREAPFRAIDLGKVSLRPHPT